jgi:hypothetical protein
MIEIIENIQSTAVVLLIGVMAIVQCYHPSKMSDTNAVIVGVSFILSLNMVLITTIIRIWL